jgi:hypothetical protein
VRATDQSGAVREAPSDASGAFSFPSLPAGTYAVVAVTTVGPQSAFPQDVEVRSGAVATITLTVDSGIR